MHFSNEYPKEYNQTLFNKMYNSHHKNYNFQKSIYFQNGYKGFCDYVLAGEGPFAFIYKDMIISLGGESFGNKFSLANKDEVLEEKEYFSTQEMLDSIRIEDKSLEEIWNDLK